MKLVDVGDATLAVSEWGGREGVPLVFWHALGPVASGAELSEIAPFLVDAGFRPVAIDGPGFGRSPLLPPERHQIASLVALLHGLLDELELDRPVLMGHSWGGVVVLSYAAAHPDDVRALVLLDSGHVDYHQLPTAPFSDAWPRLAEGEIPTLLLLATEPPHGDQYRECIDRFRAAVPHAEVRWVDGAGHGILADAGPPLGDEITTWLVGQGL
jgi:pimeloyl-ACP methyl ester carboxylesterase